MWRIRVDEIGGSVTSESILALFKSKAHISVRHELPHGNPHFHLWIDSAEEISDKAIRQRIDRRFGIKATDRSVKKCDPDRIDEYQQYLFNTKHGNKWQLIEYFNVSPDCIHDAMARAKQVSDDFAESKEHRKKSNTGPTIWELASEVEQLFDGTNNLSGNRLTRCNGSGRAEDFPDESLTEQKAISLYTELTILTLRKHKKPYDEFLLRKIITTAMGHTGRGTEILVRKMQKNFCQLY